MQVSFYFSWQIYFYTGTVYVIWTYIRARLERRKITAGQSTATKIGVPLVAIFIWPVLFLFDLLAIILFLRKKFGKKKGITITPNRRF